MIFQPVDPFPDPTHAGQEIENVGIIFSHISVIFFLIILMLYLYMKVKDILPLILTYLFSLLIGFICLTYPFMPFTPYFSLFFIFFQSIIFLIAGLDYYEGFKKKRGL